MRHVLTVDPECPRCHGIGWFDDDRRGVGHLGRVCIFCVRAEPVSPPAQPPSESACTAIPTPTGERVSTSRTTGEIRVMVVPTQPRPTPTSTALPTPTTSAEATTPSPSTAMTFTRDELLAEIAAGPHPNGSMLAAGPSTGTGGSCEDPIEWWAKGSLVPDYESIDDDYGGSFAHLSKQVRPEIVAVVRAADAMRFDFSVRSDLKSRDMVDALDALRAKLLKARGE